MYSIHWIQTRCIYSAIQKIKIHLNTPKYVPLPNTQRNQHPNQEQCTVVKDKGNFNAIDGVACNHDANGCLYNINPFEFRTHR